MFNKPCSLSFPPNSFNKWASVRENLSSGFANNTGADQPPHLLSLISAFVVLLLESIYLAISEIPIFKQVSVAGHVGLSMTWSEPPKTGFLATQPTFDNTWSLV